MLRLSLWLSLVVLLVCTGCRYDAGDGLSDGEREQLDRIRTDHYAKITTVYRERDGSVTVRTRQGGEKITYQIVHEESAEAGAEPTYHLRRVPKHVPIGIGPQ